MSNCGGDRISPCDHVMEEQTGFCGDKTLPMSEALAQLRRMEIGGARVARVVALRLH